MKNTSLLRSIPYWLLLALSLVVALVGGWLVWDNTTTMATTLLDGTATNIEVYVGQAWITAGAAILAAGIIGLLLALVLGAAKALIPTAPAVVEAIDWTTQDGPADPSTDSGIDSSGSAVEEQGASTDESEDQNGSSGSTATATKISVK